MRKLPSTTLLIFLFASIFVTFGVPSISFAKMPGDPDYVPPKPDNSEKVNQGEIGKPVSQLNDCGNGDALDLYWTPTRGLVEGTTDEPVDVFCQNLASQIQGNDNTAALAGEQN